MEKKYGKAEILSAAKSILLVIAGTLILSFGTSVFLLQFDLVAGGVSGMAIVIDHVIREYDPALSFITLESIITVFTWALFFMGLFVLGKNFALKTLVSTAIYPLGVLLFSRLASPDVLNGFFYLKGYTAYSDVALILATLLGGACVGVGCSITFIGGGSTGGVDVIAFTVCKIFKRAKSSVVFFIVDALIVVCGMFVIRDLVLSLLGITSAFVSAIMVDKVFLGSSKSFIAHVITDKYEEINREIIERLDRSSTIMDVMGGYSGKNKKMLMVSFRVNQYSEIINIINKNDKNAFVTVHQAHEINGEGWTR
jgi:uncharacterized membrane-anchored protein YitT (DUF2179 family)